MRLDFKLELFEGFEMFDGFQNIPVPERSGPCAKPKGRKGNV